MDKRKHEKMVSRGAERWQAPRLKPVVKKKGTQKVKKRKGTHAGKIKKVK